MLSLRTEQEMERRQHVRRHVVVMGRIDTGCPHLTSCIVRDLTATGARLKVTDAETLPEHFRLMLQPSGYVTQARIVWRGDNCCGVEFLPDP
jgi:PilZ domain